MTALPSRSTCSSSGSVRSLVARGRQPTVDEGADHVVEAQAVGDLDALDAGSTRYSPLIDERREARKAERAAKAAGVRARPRRRSPSRPRRCDRYRLAQRSQPASGAARHVEEPSAHRQAHRRCAVAPVLLGADHVHPPAQAALQRAQREARRSPRSRRRSWSPRPRRWPTSTDWGETARAYRDLMTQWKAAGGAQKDVDDALWKRFRPPRTRSSAPGTRSTAKLDAEYPSNAEIKRGLLDEAEGCSRYRRQGGARGVPRDRRPLGRGWQVPRDDIKRPRGRFKEIEQTIRGAEDDRWRLEP